MNKRVLVIAEGVRAERNFLNSMKSALKFDHTFCCLQGNIYLLYKKMKEVDFNADVKSILMELHPEYRELLDEKFAYTYLIFDMDPHHTKKNDDRTIGAVVRDNCIAIQEMADYFVDETDPSVGKLYVNYPMLESFRTCDSTFDEHYRDEYVSLEGIESFKRYAGTKKMASKHLKDYTRSDFMCLTKQNIYKLNWVSSQAWDMMPYDLYLAKSQQSGILAEQVKLIDGDGRVAILNTSLFMILDYYGNRDGFYDSVMSEQPVAPRAC